MPSLSFLEMVANERTHFTPLLADKPSNRIRRDLLHGKVCGIDELDSEHYGASKSMVNQVAAEMQRWGFRFERVKAAGSNQTGFKLLNPDFVPTVKIKPTPRPKKKQAPERVQPQREGGRGDLRRAIREALENGDAMSSQECQQRFNCSEGNLRSVVKKMAREGFQFDEFPSSTGKTWALRPGSQPPSAKPVGRAVEKANGHHHNERLPMVTMVNHAQQQTPVEMPPLPVFGASVQAVGQFLNPDGTVTLAFRDLEGEQWLTTLESHSVQT